MSIILNLLEIRDSSDLQLLICLIFMLGILLPFNIVAEVYSINFNDETRYYAKE